MTFTHFGIDIYPRLEPTPENKARYRQFINTVLAQFGHITDAEYSRRSDGKVYEVSSRGEADGYKQFLRMTVGAPDMDPKMPLEGDHCHYFLRFSSKSSDDDGGGSGGPDFWLIFQLSQLARPFFGSERIHFWQSGMPDMSIHRNPETGQVYVPAARPEGDHDGYYTWDEIHAAEKELRELPVTHAVKQQIDETNAIGATDAANGANDPKVYAI